MSGYTKKLLAHMYYSEVDVVYSGLFECGIALRQHFSFLLLHFKVHFCPIFETDLTKLNKFMGNITCTCLYLAVRLGVEYFGSFSLDCRD